MNIGSLLRQIRHDYGLTLKEAVEHVESDTFTVNYLSRIELGEHNITCKMFFRLLKVYCVDFKVVGLKNPTDVPATLSKLRAKHKLSYGKLSKLSGYSGFCCQHAELGKHSPSILAYLDLLAVYGYTDVRVERQGRQGRRYV